MQNKKIRLRFAPSPTGPLHIGGVRTALYSYLFAKKHNGDFILRIEDTDQNRFVPGAEEYIIESLKWCGITPNEGVGFGEGKHAPYRQSERKDMYRKYAEQLVASGYAYYAFDTAEELDAERKKAESAGGAFSYDANTRKLLKNSLMLSKEEVQQKIAAGEHCVIRLKTPEQEEIKFTDLIRGEVSFHSSIVDDKVLLKSDGMPTYHLAHIVDDVLMEITHAVRGEEWLSSAPAHILIYRYLGWEEKMPLYAHLPLLLKPAGSGKLSKRDGDKLGFPVFPLEWKDPVSGEISSGYREKGYFPEAFVNMLALLGWNSGTEQEIFSMEEMIQAFSFEHIHKAGARFDPEKTKWFNQQYLHKKNELELANFIWERQTFYHNNILGKRPLFELFFPDTTSKEQAEKELKGYNNNNFQYLVKVCSLMKEKATFPDDIIIQGTYFFYPPETYDIEIINKKWNDNSKKFFEMLFENFSKISSFTKTEIDACIKQTAAQLGIKSGEVMQLLRVLISGKGSGVDLLGILELLGRDEVCERLKKGMVFIQNKTNH